MDISELDTSKFTQVCSGYVLRCIKNNNYAALGEIKKVDKNTEAFYSMMVGNEYFEIVSKGEKHTQRALKDAFVIGNDKMNDDFKNALIRGC
jgi:hypothetical protein